MRLNANAIKLSQQSRGSALIDLLIIRRGKHNGSIPFPIDIQSLLLGQRKELLALAELFAILDCLW